MKIAEVFNQNRIPISFETFPPKGEYAVEKFREVARACQEMKPDFISVTYSAGGTGNSGRTAVLAELAKKEYGLEAMAHLTCINSDRKKVEEAIADMKARGIENVMALRGDPVKGKEPSADYPSSLTLIKRLKEEGFCVGAATYPEGHVRCESLNQDIAFLKEKEEAGADFFVTQLAFENSAIYHFLSKARRSGITKPITVGIMPMMSKDQVSRMVFMCGASLPAPIVRLIGKYEDSPEDLRKAGIEYATDQLLELCRNGVDGVHIYMMNQPDIGRYQMEILKNAGYGSC